MKYVFLIFLLLPLVCLSEDEVPPKIKKIGEYTAIITFLPENAHGELTIKRGKKIVYKQGEIGDHYYFGLDFEGNDKFSGKNITGNKISNLVVTNWTGGASCCNILYIFELGKKFRKIIELDLHRRGTELIDLDRDKNLEIKFWEPAIFGYFASAAGSPPGEVVLKYKNNSYELAPQLMKKPMLNKKKIKKLKDQIIKGFKKADGPDLPYVFLETMMNLSYSGHLDLALKIANETWPSIKVGSSEFDLAGFKKKFVDCLDDSEYWKAFSQALNKKSVIRK